MVITRLSALIVISSIFMAGCGAAANSGATSDNAHVTAQAADSTPMVTVTMPDGFVVTAKVEQPGAAETSAAAGSTNRYGISDEHCREITDTLIPEIKKSATYQPPTAISPSGYNAINFAIGRGALNNYSTDSGVQANLDNMSEALFQWNNIVRQLNQSGGGDPSLAGQLQGVASQLTNGLVSDLTGYCS